VESGLTLQNIDQDLIDLQTRGIAFGGAQLGDLVFGQESWLFWIVE
jgi:hypothetical protein